MRCQHAQHRRAERLAQMADARIVAVGGHQILHQIVGADRDEIDLFQERIDHHGGRRHFEHQADRHLAARLALLLQVAAGADRPCCALCEFLRAW